MKNLQKDLELIETRDMLHQNFLKILVKKTMSTATNNAQDEYNAQSHDSRRTVFNTDLCVLTKR